MFIAPCLPTPSKRVPTGPEWIHEITHDGYRLIVRTDGRGVRLYTRRGFNWSDRFPLIVEALRRLKARSATIDGEVVVAGPDGRPDFDLLHNWASTRLRSAGERARLASRARPKTGLAPSWG